MKMRENITNLLVFFIVVGMVIGTGCITDKEEPKETKVPATKITNLILNGGFEEENGTTPSYWSIPEPPPSKLRLYWDSSVSHNGKASISILNTNASYEKYIFWEQTITEFPVEEKLVLSGFIKTEEMSKGSIAAFAFSLEGTDAIGGITPLTDLFVGTHDWTEVKTESFIPLGVEKIHIYAYIRGTGQAWFDDLQLAASEESSTFQEGTNLLQNSGFEEITGGIPFPWLHQPGYTTEWNSHGAMLSLDKNVYYEGQTSISITNTNATSDFPFSWGQSIDSFPVNKKLIIHGQIKTEDVSKDGVVAICVRAEGEELEVVEFATTPQTDLFAGTHNWTEVKTSLVAPEEAKVILVMPFLSGTGKVWFDDIQLIVGEEAESEASSKRMTGPGIAYAQGRFQITAQEDAENPKIAFPLPLAFEDQVPIYFEIQTDPEDALKETVIKKRDEHNWIAELTFNSLNEGEFVDIAWNGYVFTKEHDYSHLSENLEIPEKDELPPELLPWLASTKCVQVDNAEIQEKAKEIRGESTSLMEIVQKTADFLQTGIVQGEFHSFDAVEALHHGGSCTSFANLAAALLRANGIPTRILAVYPTWSSDLQTHYIVEFYVPGYGWVWYESTLNKIPWDSYGDIVVAAVSSEDENRSAKGERWTGGSGVPWLSLTENLSNAQIEFLGMVNPDNNSDHYAGPVKVFDEPQEKIEEAFSITQSVWNVYLSLRVEDEEVPQEALALQREAVECERIEDYIEKMEEAERIYEEKE
ncbi:MAG: transglutaminase domain-containing protein [Euryarchaeota archaeon]|nr:transglutaminase domain-containing protein [Euryarchaeota archaeon]